MFDPLEIFVKKPVKRDRSVGSNDFLVYYRQDLPGEDELGNPSHYGFTNVVILPTNRTIIFNGIRR